MVAGQGFKDFVVGEVLTSSDVDGFLMQQSVMRFADDGARGSALGTAVGTAVPLAEGMVAYLDDINQIQVYSGSSWTSPLPGIGSNVVQTVKTDTFTTTSASFVEVTGFTVTITPSSASSKVLVIAQYSLSNVAANGVHSGLFRGSTQIHLGNEDGSRVRAAYGSNMVEPADVRSPTIVFLDSPGVATPVVYGIHIRRGAGDTAVFNRSGTDANTANHPRNAASIIAIEVAA
jgi:hypothetical protein